MLYNSLLPKQMIGQNQIKQKFSKCLFIYQRLSHEVHKQMNQTLRKSNHGKTYMQTSVLEWYVALTEPLDFGVNMLHMYDVHISCMHHVSLTCQVNIV